MKTVLVVGILIFAAVKAAVYVIHENFYINDLDDEWRKLK